MAIAPHNLLPILAFSREGKLILWLPVRDLIDTEPLVRSSEQTRKMPFHVLNIIELWCKRIVDVDDHDLPVGLFFIKEGHDP